MTQNPSRHKSRPLISIIIVTYNSANYIQDCLDALIQGVKDGAEVIVVDNNSQDSTIDLIETRYPAVLIVKNIHNVGFARAVNQAYKLSNGQVICLFNPDLVIEYESCRKLATDLISEPTVGVISPLITGVKRKMRVVAAGNYPTIWNMFLHFSGVSNLGRFLPFLEGHYLYRNQIRDIRSVQWVTGGCMLTSRTCWESVGGLSEKWFMYAEDIEYCFRVTKNGYKVLLDPNLNATHYVGASASIEGGVRSDWITNLYEFYLDSYKPSILGAVTWKILVCIGLFVRSIVFFINSTYKELNSQTIWIRESQLFLAYAIAILKYPLHPNVFMDRRKNE